jgi:hypothetical protein
VPREEPHRKHHGGRSSTGSVFNAVQLKQSLNADISGCFTLPQAFQVYEGQMIARISLSRSPLRTASVLALSVLGLGLAGCADMNDSMTKAFADPAKYDLYECKQLETERKNLATRAAELQGLMAKANTGVAGPVVAELAYRNEYVSVRGQARFADEAWERGKCHASPPVAATPAAPSAKGSRPGRAAKQ